MISTDSLIEKRSIRETKEVTHKKYFVFLLLAFSILFSCCGCDLIYGIVQKKGAEEKALIGEAHPFKYNPVVEEVQERLFLYGYSPGKIDGKLGPKTRNTIAKFQEENGLKVTRFIDKETWKKLHLFDGTSFFIDGKINIRAIQRALKNAQFDPGKIDGKLGPRTRDAIKNFQEAHNLESDGTIGFKTLDQLLQYLSS